MTKITAISGSLRKHSYNSALLRAAAAVAPPDVEIEIASIAGIPLYDGDFEERHGVPVAVTDLKLRIAESDGLLIATPEYNHSMPGVLKNAVDWLSRPPSDSARVFRDRPVGLIGASTGVVGTRMSQVAWLPTLRALGTRPWFGRLLFVSSAAQVFDLEGALTDDRTRELLTEYVHDFAAFCRENPDSTQIAAGNRT